MSIKKTAIINTRIFNGIKFIGRGIVLIENGVIKGVEKPGRVPEGYKLINAKGRITCPGLIDIHTHAAAGMDFLSIKNKSDVRRVKGAFLKSGVTSFLATTLYSPADKKRGWITSSLMKEKSGARCLGVYLEGPYINPGKKGAIPEKYISRKWGLSGVLKMHPALKIMAVAPELAAAKKVFARLNKKGVIIAFGHSAAGYKAAKQGVSSGIRHVTHLFNGMEKWFERSPAAYEAFFEDKRVTIELIADGRHVPPHVLRMAYRKFGPGRIALVSDATGNRGLYGAAREAGTRLSLLELAKRMRRFCGLSEAETLPMATSTPARAVKRRDIGLIKKGCPADLVILDGKLNLYMTIAGGRVVYNKM